MNILLPTRKAGPEFKVRVSGKYKIVAHKLDGTSRVCAEWFENLVLDAGLNRMGTGSFLDFCQVGTGSTAPANSDTTLVSRVGSTSVIQAETTGVGGSTPNYYGYRIKTFRFATGVAAGILAEVGVGWASIGSLFSRALIKDIGGTPTTITVLSDEVLDVSYEFRAFAPVADSGSFNVTFNSVTYAMNVRASLVTDPDRWAPKNQAVTNYTPGNAYQAMYNGSIAAVTAAPSGLAGAPTSITPAAYSNNSLQRDFDTFWDLNDGNIASGGSALIFTTTIGTFQVSVSPVLDKISTKRLHLNSRVSWARH